MNNHETTPKYEQQVESGITNARCCTRTRRLFIPILAGFVVGAVAVMLLVWTTMPRMMVTVHESRYGLEETCERLKAAIEAEGWNCPSIRNLNKSMAKNGVDFDRQVRIVELCNANYAKSVLETDPHVSTLMPCAFGVYEGGDGKVYISGLNTGLMGKMMGGNIAKVMGSKVSEDERKILSAVVK